MKKFVALAIILGALGMVFIFTWSTAEVQADDSMRINERKYFTSYIVENDDTLWDIAVRHMTPEYASVQSYIDEVVESNHLQDSHIKKGKMLILPYYSDAPTTETLVADRSF